MKVIDALCPAQNRSNESSGLMKINLFHAALFIFTETTTMKFLSLQPFVPSGNNFEGSKQFFLELGFSIKWDAGDYVGFEKDGCSFILQHYVNKDFAENFMLTVGVANADEFRKEVIDKQLPQKYGIRIGEVADQPYGREVNIIDLAGVCWHFVQG
jgi:hypothetical protein